MDFFIHSSTPPNGIITSVTLGQREGEDTKSSLTRCSNSIANLIFITSKSQSKKQASKLYREGNKKEKEDFSCPVKSLLLSEHVGVTNTCHLRLQYQAVK